MVQYANNIPDDRDWYMSFSVSERTEGASFDKTGRNKKKTERRSTHQEVYYAWDL